MECLLNTATWLVAGHKRSAYITDTLASYHWLHAPERERVKSFPEP